MAVFPAPPSSLPSVVEEKRQGPSSLVLHMATLADGLPAWGTNIHDRDAQLRRIWMREPLLKSAVIQRAVQYAKMPFNLEGPERMKGMYTRILSSVDRQQGWIRMWTKICIDALTRDNGGIGEIIRLEDRATSPCVSLRHLDSQRCQRTGDPDVPIRYKDQNGYWHDMKYYQVFDLVDAPMPDEEQHGAQMCAVSRILEAAQAMRDLRRYKNEKIGGRWNRSIHLTTGVSQAYIDDMLEKQNNEADAAQLLHYLSPLIIASHQADKPVSHVEIPLASLPDGFDEDVTLRWYIIELALAFLADPQDFAPLMGGHLGTGAQSETLAQKGRSKGPDLFMTSVEYIMNFKGIVPQSLTFKYGAQDETADSEKVMIQWRHSQIITQLITAGAVTPKVAARMLVDWGDLKPEYMTEMEAKLSDIPQSKDKTQQIQRTARSTPGRANEGVQ